jgi:Zn-finger nucleic acid-binding protein
MRVCPRCGAELAETPYREVRVDRCKKCGGAWFDFDEIDRALAEIPRSELARSVPEGAGTARGGVGEHAEGALPGKCPACGGNFVRVLGEIERRKVRFDTCMVCFGRWIDAEELAGLAGGDLVGKIKHLFRRLLGRTRGKPEA